jgi:hypothetical protein
MLNRTHRGMKRENLVKERRTSEGNKANSSERKELGDVPAVQAYCERR